MTLEDITKDIGKAMQNCGFIEFIVNELIRQHSTDDLLVDLALRANMPARIDLMAKLLTRADLALADDKMAQLRKYAKSVVERRNIVAHNPLTTKNEDKSDLHVVYREKDEWLKFSGSDIKQLVKDAKDVLGTLHRFIRN